jgi:hypothetical protein
MRTRILDLDGSLVRQNLLIRRARASILPLQDWGPYLRLACRHGLFRSFQKRLALLAGCASDEGTFLNFVGSGDFHHVTLALLRRLRVPCNLLVLDNHPDWMRRIPILHCGTWLSHAARLPHVEQIFHLGGDVDFDNAYRWLAPWSMLRSGKIIVSPARRSFRGRDWEKIPHVPLRRSETKPAERGAIESCLTPYRAELAARPLYVSIDKDVMTAEEAVVNWDSGHLSAREVVDVLQAFVTAAEGRLAGIDVVGDWSRVRLRGWLRHLLHWIEHPDQTIDPNEALRRNEQVNLLVWESIDQCAKPERARSLVSSRRAG